MKTRLRYIHRYTDHNGHARVYFKRKGYKSVPLPGPLGSAKFMRAYSAALLGAELPAPRHKIGTLNELVLAYYQSAQFTNLKASSRRVYRLTLDAWAERDGHRLVGDLTYAKASKIIGEIGATRPGMANLSRAVFRRLMDFAIKRGQRRDNPFELVEHYRLGTHHTWTDAQLLSYEARWPVGSREHLAYALLLYTGQRVGDVSRMRRGDIRDGAIHLTQEKTGAELAIEIHPALAKALEHFPGTPLAPLVAGAGGKALTADALSKLIVKAASQAGLPRECVAHGLRKAMMRRLAESGASTKELQSVSGHRTLGEVQRYTDKAEQRGMARRAIARLDGK
jgi:integrase